MNHCSTAIKERPILFSGPMVRALLDGRKTQTRRIAKKWPMSIECPYGEIRDRLWVRETWRLGSPFESTSLKEFNYPEELNDHLHYKADDDEIGIPMDGQYRPSIFMPHSASRITLEITGVRVERLNEISHHDALQEGLIEWSDPPRVTSLNYGLSRADCWETDAPMAFKRLWSTIHAADGPNGWAANPWVWVIGFKKI